MFNKKSFKVALLAGICLLPRLAIAGEDATPQNEVWIGATGQSDSSAKYGRYNASPDKGIYTLGGFNVNESAGWDQPGPYFKAEGDNLSFRSHDLMPNASGSASIGVQGLWGAKVFFDDIEYNQSQTFHTLFNTDGSLVNGLTPGSLSMAGIGYLPAAAPAYPTNSTVNAADTALSALVTSKLNVMSIGTERAAIGAALSYSPFPDWKLSADLKHEHKTGTKENSLTIGGTSLLSTTGGNMLYFPEPVDYDTNRYTVMAAYDRQRVQARLSYTLSTFTDNIASFNPADPFNAAVHAGYANSIYSLPPDNTAQQIKAQLGYNFSPTTRWMADLGYGMQFQNAPFVGSLNAPTSSVPTDLTRTSFNGEVQNINANLTMVTKPIPPLDIKINLGYNSSENQSPSLTFHAPDIDKTTCTSTSNTGCNAIINTLPYSFKTQTVGMEGGYRVTPSLKLTVGDTYKITDRTYSASTGNNENTMSAQLSDQFTSSVNGSVGISHAIRKSGDYNGVTAWTLNGDTGEAGSIEATGLTHFIEAPRIRDELKGRMSVMSGENLSLSFSGKYYNDNYNSTLYGLTGDRVITANPDMTYIFSDSVTGHAFYSFEQAFYNINDTVAVTGLPYFAWQRQTANRVHTIGLNGDWKPTEKLKFGLGYTFQLGNTGWDLSGASTLNPTTNVTSFYNYSNMTLPNDKSTTNRVELTGEYEVINNVSLNLGYAVERFKSNDYLNSQTASDPSYANYTLPGDGSPNYLVQTLGASIHVKW